MSIMLVNPYVTGPTDPFFLNVVCLCHCDGANGSTTFINVVTPARGTTLGANSPCSVSSSSPLFGNGCCSVAPNGYLAGVTSADYGYGTGDFTLEFAFKTASPSATVNIFDTRTTAVQLASTIYTLSGAFHYYDGTNDISGGTVLTDTWQRIAYSRNGTTGRLFVDGTQVATYTDNNDYPNRILAWGTTIGSFPTAFYDELRITKGVGRRTGNYTVDAAPFPDA